jgi:hypothetical protein
LRLRDGGLFTISIMHKNKSARLQAGKNGGVEVVLTLTPETIAKADEFAARLQVSREEILAAYYADTLATAPDAIEDHCLAAWTFPTKAKAQAFIRRERMNPSRYIVEQWESGGWSVTDTARYEVIRPFPVAVAV